MIAIPTEIFEKIFVHLSKRHKQLPPTNIFDRMLNSGDEKDDKTPAALAGSENILDTCSSSFVPRPILKVKPKTGTASVALPKPGACGSFWTKHVSHQSPLGRSPLANDVTIPANEFVLTMLNGSPFIYSSFVKTVLNRAIREAESKEKVPYACGHAIVAWSSLIGVTKEKIVSLTGHNTRKMVDVKYGKYRNDLVDE